MARTRDYRSFLRVTGRRPIRGKIRTKREPGHVEIVWDPRTGEDVLHRFGDECRAAD